MRRLPLILIILMASTAQQLLAQAADSSKEILEENFQTFRLVNGHSVETVWKGYLMMTISHRFIGTVDEGIGELFGLDRGANFRLGFAYGITDNLTVGLGRSTSEKMYDGYVKYRFLRQTRNGSPVTTTLFASAGIGSEEFNTDEEAFLEFRHRMAYNAQLLIARSFGKYLSVQVGPSILHQNYTALPEEGNTTFALNTALAVNFNEKMSLTIEYMPVLNQGDIAENTRYDAVGFSFNIRSSKKHEYQIQFTNTSALIEQQYVMYTRDGFFDNGIHFGFHMTRMFGL